jgi:hypothetical protein
VLRPHAETSGNLSAAFEWLNAPRMPGGDADRPGLLQPARWPSCAEPLFSRDGGVPLCDFGAVDPFDVVMFRLDDRGWRRPGLVGSWDPRNEYMLLNTDDGARAISLSIPDGIHWYAFNLDGVCTADPERPAQFSIESFGTASTLDLRRSMRRASILNESDTAVTFVANPNVAWLQVEPLRADIPPKSNLAIVCRLLAIDARPLQFSGVVSVGGVLKASSPGELKSLPMQVRFAQRTTTPVFIPTDADCIHGAKSSTVRITGDTFGDGVLTCRLRSNRSLRLLAALEVHTRGEGTPITIDIPFSHTAGEIDTCLLLDTGSMIYNCRYYRLALDRVEQESTDRIVHAD